MRPEKESARIGAVVLTLSIGTAEFNYFSHHFSISG